MRSFYRSLPAPSAEPIVTDELVTPADEPIPPVELSTISIMEAVLDPATVFEAFPKKVIERDATDSEAMPSAAPSAWETVSTREDEVPAEPRALPHAETISGSAEASPSSIAPLVLPKESWLKRWKRRWWCLSRVTSATILLGTQWIHDGVARLRHLPFLTPAERAEQRYRRTVDFQLRVDADVPADSVAFFGDQTVERLTVTAVTELGVNYGIAGDTVSRLQRRIRRYRILSRYRAVVLAIGSNDLATMSDADMIRHYTQLLDALPLPVVVCGLLPVDERVTTTIAGQNQRIEDLNQGLRELCQSRSDRRFVDASPDLMDDTGQLSPDFHTGDGVQLSAAGYSVWVHSLRHTLGSRNATMG